MYSVYVITNRLNGKVYVGQTGCGVPQRWRGHVKASKRAGWPLYQAIRKHGLASFEIQEVATVESEQSSSNLERLWILCLQASDSKFGYNCTAGGDGCTKPNLQTLEKRSRSLKAGYASGRIRHNRFRTELRDEDIVRLYFDDKLSARSVAKVVGCSYATVKFRLKKLGKTLRPKTGTYHGGHHLSAATRAKMSVASKLKWEKGCYASRPTRH